jgi:GAF domain-containing protein
MLEQMNQRLKGCTTFEAAVGTILRDVVALHGAEFGSVQLVAGDSLLLVDERGLEIPFLVAFRDVRKSDGCACARAWRSKAAVIVEDVKDDAAYAEFIEVAQEAGYRSVQSTPLIASDGTFFGVVSTLFANMHKPSRIEMETVQAYSRLAADHLQKVSVGRDLEDRARTLHRRLYAQLGR